MSKVKNNTKPVEKVEEPIAPVDATPAADVSEPVRHKTLAGLMDHAKENNPSDVDASNDVAPEETGVDTEPTEEAKEPSRFSKEAIAELIANKIPLMQKLDQLVKLLPQPSNNVVSGLRGLYTYLSEYRDREADINKTQRAIYRSMKQLLSLDQNEFNEQYKYINWVYKQLLDKELLEKEKQYLVSGESPLHIMNIFLFASNKDDAELSSFIYLMTYIDFRATDKNNAFKGKSGSLAKTTVKSLLSPEDIEKLDKYYNAD